MSRKDFIVCIEILVVTFMLGVIVGMCIQVLGVPVNACAEMENNEEGYVSGMPCENPEQFRRWYETYEEEQTTGEEEESVGDVSETGASVSEEMETESYQSEQTPETESMEESVVSEVSEGEEIWYVNGERVDRTISDALMSALERHGIGYWMSGALAQCYQESRMQQYAVSRDGMDHGILQYRAKYWPATCAQYGYSGADIYSIYVQFDIYATQMANRFSSGMGVADAVSRHKTSDYGGYDAVYYSQVSQWFNTVERIADE